MTENRRRKTAPAGRMAWFHSLQMKFAASYLSVTLAIVLIMNTYPIIAAQSIVFQTKETALQTEAGVVASNLAGLELLTTEGVARIMGVIDEGNLNRVLVTDPSGRILYDSETGGAPLGAGYALFQEIVLALQGQDVFQSTYQNGAFRSGAAMPVVYRNATVGAVYLYEYDSEQGLILQGLQNTLRNISLVILGVGLLVSVVLSRTMTRRISGLLSATQSLREGEYSHRVEIRGHDELAMLADEYNQLTERLQETDEVRRRFVSDASHELKTPLATIRLLTDSILESGEQMDSETLRDFVSDIGTEAGRLNRITEKLLSLTRLDSGTAVPRERVDLAEVATEVLHRLSPLAEGRGITFETELQPKCVILAGFDDLYQVIFNLVENAIKYNCPEGLVRLLLRREDDRVSLRVEDTGIGIPEDEREKVFDRFYRVDKARSRAAGGAGLGLSIVRDTVHLHGGWLTVEPRAGGGSCFQVTFPAAEEEKR